MRHFADDLRNSFFPAGATITFTTEDYGLACYTGQRKRDSA